MNIWTLNKTVELRAVLLLLQSQLGTEAFIADTSAPCSDHAIWLSSCHLPDARAYLYTIGQASERYGVHLEYPYEDTPLYDVYENLQLSRLTEILAVHFDVADVHPLPGV